MSESAGNRIVTHRATSVLLRLLVVASGVGTAVSVSNAGNAPEVAELRYWILGWGIATTVLTFLVWLVDDQVKRVKEGQAVDAQQLLEAERIRISTATNGAFLPTLKTLQHLATSEINERRMRISGFRQAVIDRASDLLRNDAPRVAFFQVEDLRAPSRVMKPEPVSQRNRTDEFTTEFREDDVDHREVWTLIDFSDSYVLEPDATAPGRVYACYISVPVRAGGIAFGMLTANTIEAEGLSREDADNMLVMARMLAAAEGLVLTTKERREILEASETRSIMPVEEEASE